MGILMSAYVGDTDAQAQDEAKEGVWYFLKNCLKGHLRREGRQLTFGPGIPYIPAGGIPQLSEILRSDRAAARRRRELGRPAAVGRRSSSAAPTRSTRRIMDILEHAKVGHLLIQFHLGNMPDALARKSMTLVRARGCAAAAGAFGETVRASIPRHGTQCRRWRQ